MKKLLLVLLSVSLAVILSSCRSENCNCNCSCNSAQPFGTSDITLTGTETISGSDLISNYCETALAETVTAEPRPEVTTVNDEENSFTTSYSIHIVFPVEN